MKEFDANIHIMQHMMHRVNEFLNENNVDDIPDDVELGKAFSRFLRIKERTSHPVHTLNGARAQKVNVEDVIDDETATIAMLKFVKDGTIALMWSPVLFERDTPMPDEVRELVVACLRFHADKLESREMDERVKSLTKGKGAA